MESNHINTMLIFHSNLNINIGRKTRSIFERVMKVSELEIYSTENLFEEKAFTNFNRE